MNTAKSSFGLTVVFLLLVFSHVGGAAQERPVSLITFDEVVTERAVRETVACLEQALEPTVGFLSPLDAYGVTKVAGRCARQAAYDALERIISRKVTEGDKLIVMWLVRWTLNDPTALKATYGRFKPLAVASIKKWPASKVEKLESLFGAVKKYFTVSGLDSWTVGLLEKQAQLYQAWLVKMRTEETGAAMDAYTVLYHLEEWMYKAGITKVVSNCYEWAKRRLPEGGPELVAAWLWLIQDLEHSL